MPKIMLISAGSISATDTNGDSTQLGSTGQGEGSHLGTVTIDAGAGFQAVQIEDSAGRSGWFEDSEDQTLAEDTDVDGTTYSAGTLAEAEYRITLQDSEGNTYTAWAVEIEDGDSTTYENVVGLIFEEGKVPPFGEELRVVDSTDLYDLDDNNTKEYEYDKGVPCFTAGTLVETPSGLRPIETLQAGDLVITRDNGPRPLRWISHRALTEAELRAAPHLKPIILEPGCLAPGAPARRTRLSPQHRVLVSGPGIELCFEEAEVLVKAKHLVDGHMVRRDEAAREVTYYHLLFDTHEIVMADGMWSESFFPGSSLLREGDGEILAELEALFPEQMRGFGQSGLARAQLRGWEAVIARQQLNPSPRFGAV